MGIVGDDRRLQDLIQRLRLAGRRSLRRPLLLGARVATEQLVQTEFARERGPDGDEWVPTKELQHDQALRGLKRISRVRRRATKEAREQMRKDLQYAVKGRYFLVTGTHAGDGYFNYGSSHQLPRPYLPPFELPRGWQTLYAKQGREVLVQFLRPERSTPEPWLGGALAG